VRQSQFLEVVAIAKWVAANILRIQDGILIEHWDVIQDEVARDQSKSGRPMFGESFPVYR
jgi:predicted SnoaL-like aldol condensation-catalyzing enzyme